MLKFRTGFRDQRIQLAGLEVGLNLLIPHAGVEFEEPRPELRQIFGGEIGNPLFKLLNFTHRTPPLISHIVHQSGGFAQRLLCGNACDFYLLERLYNWSWVSSSYPGFEFHVRRKALVKASIQWFLAHKFTFLPAAL